MSELIPEPEPAAGDAAAAAIALAARGFAVFPLRPNAKTPAVPRDWEHAATTDPERLAALFRDRRANLAVACGPSRLLVIDLDVAKEHGGPDCPGAADPRAGQGDPGRPAGAGHPAHGADVLRELAAGREIPRTLTIATPTGGRHLYFRMPAGVTLRNTAGRLGPLIDTRAGGGYVVAPGSVIDGLAYRIAVDAPVAALPQWLTERLATPIIPPDEQPGGPDDPGGQDGRGGGPGGPAGGPPRSGPQSGPDAARRPDRLRVAYTAAALRNEVERVNTAAPGTRNDTLNRAAYSLGRLIGAGLLDRDEVTTQLQRAARSAGLPAREVVATTRSGLAAGIAHPRIPLAIAVRSQYSAIHGRIFERTFLGENAAAVLTADADQDPEPADWPEAFGDLVQLRQVCRVLRRELTDPRPSARPAAASSDGAGPDPAAGTGPLAHTAADIITVLHAVCDAQEDVGFAASALSQSAEWHLIRSVTDALRDLLDELENGVQDYSAVLRKDHALNSLVRSLAAAACRQNAKLANEIIRQLSKKHLSRSPVWSALRDLHKVADNAATFLENHDPVLPPGARDAEMDKGAGTTVIR